MKKKQETLPKFITFGPNNDGCAATDMANAIHFADKVCKEFGNEIGVYQLVRSFKAERKITMTEHKA